jgi:DNA-binding beta-propeller fold protein YncE
MMEQILIRTLVVVAISAASLTSPVKAKSPTITIESPVRLTVMERGNLLVSDHAGNRVLEWDPTTNEVVKTFDIRGIPGPEEDIPGRATGIAYGWGRVFVGNEITRSVEVYSRSGRFQSVLGGQPGQVSRPNDIVVDADAGLVFVVDVGTQKVLVYDSGGILLRTLPAQGAEPLYRPAALTVDPTLGEVLVSDFGKIGSFSTKPKVNIYDYYGNDMGQISGSSQLPEYRFSAPQGLAVNEQGLIYLVDSFRGQVLVFDRMTGQGVATIGEPGRGPGNLLFPLDVDIDPKTSDVYVTNYRLGRIEVFKGMGLLP